MIFKITINPTQTTANTTIEVSSSTAIANVTVIHPKSTDGITTTSASNTSVTYTDTSPNIITREIFTSIPHTTTATRNPSSTPSSQFTSAFT